MINGKTLSLAEWEVLMKEWGQPAYTAREIWSWLYAKGALHPEAMTNLSQALRRRLAEFAFPSLETIRTQRSRDGAVKYVFRGYEGRSFESVFLPTTNDRTAKEYHTVCVSTQVGCAVKCPFCATGKMGFQANLTASEMLEQVQAIEREQKVQVRNIVLMGMGEPLLNYDAVVEALTRWRKLKGLSWKRITLSTSGYRPGLERLIEAQVPVRLALSLHAPTNELRDRLVPINKTYPLETLWPLCQAYSRYSGESVTLEYVLLGGVNDGEDMAKALARVAGQIACKVNLIPWNPVGETEFSRPTPERMKVFVEILRRAGVMAIIRRERGVEIDAACGQLIQQGKVGKISKGGKVGINA